MLRVLDLFSGIGGFSLGLERAGGFETVAFCEIDKFCQQVLAKHWPGVPIYDDVKKLNGGEFRGAVDVICGGFPCQPFSFAGKRGGAGDDRALWPEFARLIREIKPRWVLGENVPGIVTMGLDVVLSDLERLGYATEAFIIPACAVDAPHRRDRVWIIGNGNGKSEPVSAVDAKAQRLPVVANAGFGRCSESNRWEGEQSGGAETERGSETIPDSCGIGPQRGGFTETRQRTGDALAGEAPTGSLSSGNADGYRWQPEPDVGRVANGVPNRSHRLKSLGNAVVPQIPEIIGRAILEASA